LTREQGPQGGAGQAYYVARILLPPEEIKRLGDLQLVPGMPVEAYIRTHDRTPLEYILKPLQEQIARTFRER
jgi:HlyD family secretion protein